MINMVKYTTAQIVRDQLAGRVASYLTDAMIEQMIETNEGIIDAVTQLESITFAQTTSRHNILRKASTMMTAADVLMSAPVSFQTMDQATMAAELAVYWYENSIKWITGKDSSIRDFVETGA